MERHYAAYMEQQNSTSEILLRAVKRTVPPVLDKEIRIPGKTAYLRALRKPQTDLSLQAIAQKDDKNLYLIIRLNRR